jgi:hypothetical protein
MYLNLYNINKGYVREVCSDNAEINCGLLLSMTNRAHSIDFSGDLTMLMAIRASSLRREPAS